jgi:hypothetical protein
VIGRMHHYFHATQRGQALLEMTMILPVFLLLVLGTLEFGMAFDHNLTLEYASREGARVGAALASGSASVPCANVDDYVVAAIERVLVSSGSPVDLTRVTQIRIFLVDTSNSNGQEPTSSPSVNRWIYALNQGPVVDGQQLDFKKDPAVQSWNACGRNNGSPPDSIGVGINYTYNLQTPLGNLLGGMVKIDMHDQSVMALNPTGK